MDGQADPCNPSDRRDVAETLSDHDEEQNGPTPQDQEIDSHLEEDLEQPDGQRNSLSLDDEDGGSNFEASHQLETVIRRTGGQTQANSVSPVLHESSSDNDIVFNPAQKLNFDEDDNEDEDDDDDDDYAHEVPVNYQGGGQEFMASRPVVNGSDLQEGDTWGGTSPVPDQGQNIRIIEGHDSSLLDDGNLSYNFNFLHTQMIQLPAMSPPSGNNRMDDSSHNLYDSLEREDGAGLFDDHHPHTALDNNTSEYFSAGSMSLLAANSQGPPDTDSVWAQDDNSDHTNFLSHSQQTMFHGQHNATEHPARQQSPPRNFQIDTSNVFVSRGDLGDGGGPVSEGALGGYGDVRDDGNAEVLSLELSEEGLMNSAPTYAQPVANGPLGGDGSGAVVTLRNEQVQQLLPPLQASRDEASGQVSGPTERSGPIDNVMSTKVPVGGQFNAQSQPKNLAWNQKMMLQGDEEPHHVDGDGLEAEEDERQAGAGSSATVQDTNQSAGDSGGKKKPVVPVKKSVPSKAPTRRPAVQGSASGDSSRAAVGNPQLSASHTSTVPVQVRKPSRTRGNVQGDSSVTDVSGGARKKTVTGKGKNGVPPPSASAASVSGQGRHLQGHSSPLTSRANSHTSLASNASSTNSRMSGVGKESQHQPAFIRGQAGDQRLDKLAQGEMMSGQNSQQVMSSGSKSGPMGYQPHQSQSFDRAWPSTTSQNQKQLRPSHSFNKSQSSHSYPHSEPVMGSDWNVEAHNFMHHHGTGNTMNSASVYGGRMYPHQFHPQQQHESNNPQHYQQHKLAPEQHHHYHPGPVHALSPCGSDGSHHSYNRESVVSQMESMRQQGQTLSPEPGSHLGQLDNDIQGMEDVRSHLQNMLRIGVDSSLQDTGGADHQDTATDLLLSEQPLNRRLQFDSAESSAYLGNNTQEMSEILENFPSFSSKMFSDMSSNRTDTALHGENQYLRDNLEKERYRRKHCEEHIQKLNTKLLEVQQQLAVAVSTDKRKDIMIEQLDKQLAKVVEGWKRREAEKDEYLKKLSKEKEDIEENMQRQQTMINNFERDLSDTVAELRAEKERSSQAIDKLQEELEEAKSLKDAADQVLASEQQKFDRIKAQWDEMKQAREAAETTAQKVKQQLMEEQDTWEKKERELNAKIVEVKEANQKVINMEKIRLEEQKKKREEAETEKEELKTELKKVVLDMEQLVREKESQKVEMAITEARFESAQRKLEADLHAQMEKEIADQASEFHSRIEKTMEEAAERHRKQVAELHGRHQRDMERQMAALNEDRQRKEEEYRKQITDLEERLQELRSENSSLKQSKLKLESQRMEILTKLQFMMQSQWNEAVSLLVSTPQRKSLNSSFMSSQSGSQLASALAVTDGAATVTNLMASGLPGPMVNRGGQDHQGQGQEEVSRSSPSFGTGAGDGGGNENGERREEVNRMDRVEEYLERLSQHMDSPMSRNELSSGPPHSSSSNNLAFSQLNSMFVQHRQQQQQQQQQLANGETDSSTRNGACNLSSSGGASSQVHGFVSGPNGQTLITGGPVSHPASVSLPSQSSGHTVMSKMASDQCAVAMRSPRQGSRINHTDTAHNQHHVNAPPANHPFLFGNHYDNFPTAHHSMQQQRQHQHHHLPSSSPNNCNFMKEQGDTGDYKDRNLSNGTNINLYSPEASSIIASPEQWQFPSSRLTSSTVPVKQTMTGAVSVSASSSTVYPTSPSSNTRPMAARMGGQSPGARGAGLNSGVLNESLSPPVRQMAERDHVDNSSEVSQDFLDANRLESNYSHLSDRLDEHNNRQEELQHYVRMLLQKAPGSMCSEPERDNHSEHDILESSRDLTDYLACERLIAHFENVDLDLNDTAQAMELTSQLARLQHLRERQNGPVRQPQLPQQQPPPAPQAGSSNNVQESLSNDSITGHIVNFIGEDGVISSQGLSEISQLLSVYREQWETNPDLAGQTNVAEQLLDALKGMGSRPDMVPAKREEKKTATKNSPKGPSGHRKLKEPVKGRKSRNESADSSLNVDNNLSRQSHPQAHPPRRGSSHDPAAPKERKVAGQKATTSANSKGGPAWK